MECLEGMPCTRGLLAVCGMSKLPYEVVEAGEMERRRSLPALLPLGLLLRAIVSVFAKIGVGSRFSAGVWSCNQGDSESREPFVTSLASVIECL